VAIRTLLSLVAVTCFGTACERPASVPPAAAPAGVPILIVESADALRPYDGRVVTLRGHAFHMKRGVSISGRDVRVDLPDATRNLFDHDVPERDVEITGRLRFVRESYWYRSVNDDMGSPIGMVQDTASHQEPVTFRLETERDPASSPSP
jgi:hypothetical protein